MNQHYVPRVYLKFFAKKVKKEYFVDVYEKNNERYFLTNIKNICAEKHFYTLDKNQTVANDVFAIENIYGTLLEPIYKKAYDILVNPNITKITHEQHNEILIGILQMYMRNPKILNNVIKNHTFQIKKDCEEAKSKNQKGITYLKEDYSFREFSENEIINIVVEKATKEYKERHIIGTKEICEFHINAKYEVSEIIDHGEFLTSDNPLVFEDMITKDEHPLLKSKEFLIPLNKKFALRVYHDNTKKINFIYREKIPHGNANIINDNIFNNSSKFVIGSKNAFNDYFKMQKYLNDTSIELKMDAIKQVLANGEHNEENKELGEIMKFYLDKYEKEGGLSKIEKYNFYMKIREMNANWKRSRLK